MFSNRSADTETSHCIIHYVQWICTANRLITCCFSKSKKHSKLCLNTKICFVHQDYH